MSNVIRLDERRAEQAIDHLADDMQLAAYVRVMHREHAKQAHERDAVLLTCAMVLEDAIETAVSLGDIECLTATVAALRRVAERGRQ
jgi:hypothetical protein